ncbi:MAG: pentapeptide repeat-containing protein [Methyloceanibacter sp.]|nr:pentapeptide repeat-containing protein [Methyloceanibacter sp.]
MTIPEHMEILRRGPRIWNAWRAENPSIVPDLTGIALSIGDRQMGPINGGPINLSRALLNEAALYFATLTGADMRGADLTNADLRGARLEGVDLTGADLAGAQLDGASLGGAVLKAANLSGASLADARDLTTDQIGEAEGNLGTVLPYDLDRPALWSVGQGVLHIQTAQDVAEHGTAEPYAHREWAREADASENQAEPTPMTSTPMTRMAYQAEPQTERPDSERTAEPEPAKDEFVVADAPTEDVYDAEPAVLPSPVAEAEQKAEPSDTSYAETPAVASEPTMPNSTADFPPRPAPERQRPAQQSMSTGSNGHSNGHGEPSHEQQDRENKHVSWLVGGPRRAGRPARNWRDRA